MQFAYTCGQKPLEGYTIKRGVASGGFGEVYFGLSDGGKEVALKCLFRNQDIELRGIGQCLNLKHPHLVHLYDLRTDAEGKHWLVMEYVRGETMHHLLQRHPSGLDRDLAKQWFGQISAAVHFLHEQGIVHRDLKPANVFVENGLVKIGDYGLCKFISSSQHRGQTQNIGTLHYMAPEIGKGDYTRSVDIYASGILFHEMLTGKVPFDGETSAEILLKHLSQMPDLSRTGPFAGVIQKALEKDPKRRFATLAEMSRRVGEIGQPMRESWAPTHVPAHVLSAATLPGESAWSPPSPSPTTVALSPPRSWSERARSLALAGAVAFALSVTLGFILGDWRRMIGPFTLATLCSWTILLLARLWSGPAEDSVVRRLTQGVLGIGIGVFAVWLQGYGLSDALSPRIEVGPRHPFYGSLFADNQSLSVGVGHVGYYGLMFLILRWWRATELKRAQRFALPALLASGFWAFALLFLLPTAEERQLGFVGMVIASVAVQLASPRRDPDPAPSHRLRWRYA